MKTIFAVEHASGQYEDFRTYVQVAFIERYKAADYVVRKTNQIKRLKAQEPDEWRENYEAEHGQKVYNRWSRLRDLLDRKYYVIEIPIL